MKAQDYKNGTPTEISFEYENIRMRVSCFDEDSDMTIIVDEGDSKAIMTLRPWEVTVLKRFLSAHLRVLETQSSTTSADNQTSQIADKDWREELSRLKEENERLRASYYKLWKKTSPPPNESPDK